MFVEINLAAKIMPSRVPKEAQRLLVSSAKNFTKTLKPYEARLYVL